MNKYLIYSALSTLILLTTNLYSQDDSGYEFDMKGDTLKSVFRPRIGMGTGVMAYFGEVQDYQQKFSPMVNRIGANVYVNAPISGMFNVEFSATYAKIGANERTLSRNLNFESRLRMGTLSLYYNFYPFFQKNRNSFHPYLGVGISSFEFLSKTDALDAQGNPYYYWSDGSIMNMDESDPLAANAVPLKRDYSYETDLRELNSDNLGKYREQSFALPLSVGAEWHLSPRWDFRISTVYYFTFTDLIDNISPAGEGIRSGDKNSDRLLFTSVSLSYDLVFGKNGENKAIDPLDEGGIPLFADWDQNDFDHDGVIDALDLCSGTPLEALVDSSGCPLDGDEDGVPDYLDDEPNTELGSYVNEYGVTLSEEDIADHARLYYDSTGYEHDFSETRTEVILKREKTIYSTGKDDKKPVGLKYVIVVGKERKDVTVNELHKYLGYRDYTTFSKGDTMYYSIGAFESIADAVAAKADLENQGITVEDISRNNESSDAITPVDKRVIDKVEDFIKKDDQYKNKTDIENTTDNNQFYRVQLGAFKNQIDAEKVFPGIDVIFTKSNKDNLVRYYTGSFETYEEAMAFSEKIKNDGIKHSFVMAYEKEERVTLKEAGIPEEDLPQDYNEEEELETFVEPRDTSNNDVINENKIKYRIELAYFEEEIPIETVEVLYNIKQILPVKGENGSTTYYSAPFETIEERDAAMIQYQMYDLENMKPIVEYLGKYYSPEEFNEKFGE